MKICLISNPYPPPVIGGAEIYVEQLARALSRDHQVVVVSTDAQPHLRLSRVVADGITLYRLGPLNLVPDGAASQIAFRLVDFAHPQVLAGMQAVLAAERPDVIHVHNWIGLSLAALLQSARFARIPVALTLHDYALLCIRRALWHPPGRICGPDAICRAYRPIQRWLTHSIPLIVSPSRYVLDQHRRLGFFREADCRVLPNGFDAGPLVVHRLPKPTFDILFLGRVQSHKGVDTVVRAFRQARGDHLRLHVAGTGPDLDACRTLATGDRRIIFHGFVEGSQKQRLLETADLLVVPSRWQENHPVSIQEAFAWGRPVLASNIGGLPEMIEDGTNGVLVPPGEEPALTAAIERLSADTLLVGRLSAGARASSGRYDMAAHLQALTDAYRQLRAVRPTRESPPKAA